MVCPRSELFDAHPEYATELKGRGVQLIRNQRVLDLANPVVEEYVYKCVADILREHPRVAYIKWDHNATLGANPGSHVDLDNQGAFSDKFTEAYYRIMEKLRKNFPNVIFQACGSGGMRGDIGALQYSEEIWGSDQTNGINRISIQWGWSHFLPVKAVAAHVGCLNDGDYKFRTDAAMTARLGVELDPDSQGARRLDNVDNIAKGIAVYKQLRPLLHSADLYRGRSPMVSQTTELTFVAQDKSEAVLFGFKRDRGARTEVIKASGLDANAKYKLTEMNTDTEPRIEAGQTLTGAQLFAREYDIPIIGLPGTIDNDLYGTDATIGYDSALNTIVECVDKIRDTANSHDRIFFIEVMGRDAGFLAQNSAIASGAEAAIIPESATDVDQLADFIERGKRKSKNSAIVLVSEAQKDGVGGAFYYAERVKKEYPQFDARVTILGHLQRGGTPSAYDRILASRMGYAAIEALLEGQRNIMIGIKNDEIVYVPISRAVKMNKPINQELITVLNVLSM